MVRHVNGSIMVIFAAISFSGSAFAQPVPCAERTEILGRLSADYAESVVAQGLTSQGTLLEVTAASDGATWTALVTVPDGPTCLVAAGEGWQAVAPRPSGKSM